MTETRTPLTFEKYQYGALAGYLASSDDESTKRFAASALEVLAGPKGFNLGEEAEGFVRGTQASDKGIQTAIGTYAGIFQEKRGEYKPSDLASWYAPVLSGLDDESKGKIDRELSKHDETLKDIEKKLQKSAYILDKKAPKGFHSNDAIESAKATRQKYAGVFTVMSTLDKYMFENLRVDAVDASRIEDLKNLASKL